LRSTHLLLRDIAESRDRIASYISGLDEAAFLGNSLVFDAVLRNLTVIGEAVKQLPAPVQQLDPDVPWSLIARFRDLITHAYFRVNGTEVWEIASTELPERRARIATIQSHPDIDPAR